MLCSKLYIIKMDYDRGRHALSSWLSTYAEGLAGCLCMALDSNPRAVQVIWVKMASAYALRLTSRTGKGVRRCPL